MSPRTARFTVLVLAALMASLGGLAAITADYALADAVSYAIPVLVFAVALGWSGRAAWAAAAIAGGVIGVLARLMDVPVVPVLLFTVPTWLVGTVVRIRAETSAALRQRGEELEHERELVADLARRHERSRIAGELHDVVGHAISVLVVQAAAGQRLVEVDPAGAQRCLDAAADAARAGSDDVGRLLELLGGGEPDADLDLIATAVDRAARHGVSVSCRFRVRPSEVAGPTAALALRVVQESLTNALRHAPGAEVRVTVDHRDGMLIVEVENGPANGPGPRISGTGRGLEGLRARAVDLHGRLQSGPTAAGGWQVAATLPA